MGDLFEPLAGVPKWQLLAEFMRAQGYDVVPRGEMAAAADVDPANVPALVHAVNRKLADEGFRLVAVGHDYKRATAVESLHESTSRRVRQIGRVVNRGKAAARAALSHEGVTPEVARKAADACAHWDTVRSAVGRERSKLRRLTPELPVVRRSFE